METSPDRPYPPSRELRPVRVGVDLTAMLPGSANGGAKFAVLQLLDGLLQHHRDQVRLTLFVPEITRDELARRFGDRAEWHCTRAGRQRGSPLREACRELRNHLAIRRLARREELDVLYSPFGRYLMVSKNISLIALIMDLLHEDFSESISWKDRLWRRLNLRKLAISGAQIQVPSEFTRERLHRVCRIPYARTFRTYLPIHERLGPRRRPQTTTPFFFYPARPWKHKNHQNLLRAFRRYRERMGIAAWRLVLTAGNDQLTCDLKRLAGELNLGNHVDFIGDVSEEQLARYYQDATALVFPSYYEGFGIPLLEAMHFGLPIICGRGGSQAEIAGDAAFYVDAGDIEELAGAMCRISCDADLRRRLVDAGRQQLTHFAWRPEVQTLANAFKQVAGASPGHPIGGIFRQACLVGFDAVYAAVVAFVALLDLIKARSPN